MKYFTLDFYRTRNDWYTKPELPGPVEHPWKRYSRHLEEMEGNLPADLLALARQPGVDDGLVVLARHDRARRVLTLTLRCGYAQMGYYDLALRYEGADISPEHERTLVWIARTTRSDRRHEADVAYHELDRAEDGRIEHRLLFHGGLWFAVRCEALRWARLPRRDRRLPRRCDRFPGGPVTPVMPGQAEAGAEQSASVPGP